MNWKKVEVGRMSEQEPGIDLPSSFVDKESSYDIYLDYELGLHARFNEILKDECRDE